MGRTDILGIDLTTLVVQVEAAKSSIRPAPDQPGRPSGAPLVAKLDAAAKDARRVAAERGLAESRWGGARFDVGDAFDAIVAWRTSVRDALKGAIVEDASLRLRVDAGLRVTARRPARKASTIAWLTASLRDLAEIADALRPAPGAATAVAGLDRAPALSAAGEAALAQLATHTEGRRLAAARADATREELRSLLRACGAWSKVRPDLPPLDLTYARQRAARPGRSRKKAPTAEPTPQVDAREQALIQREQALDTREMTIITREQAVIARELAVAAREQAIVTREAAVAAREAALLQQE